VQYVSLEKMTKSRPTKYPKSLRLKDFPYKGCYRYFITLRCYNQSRHFSESNLIEKSLRTLKKTAEQRSFLVWAYCFMPDHLHLLIEGKTDDADMRRFISVFKQRTAFSFKRSHSARLWQPNYYERVLRKDETTSAAARYIFENPVRKGIVKEYHQYAHLGSFEFSNVSQLFV
jgi:putative transposase